MFEKSNSFSKVLTAALIAVSAVPFITSCGTQQDAVPEKTAAAPVIAPAAAWSDADLQKMLGSIREDNKVRYLVYKNDLIHKQYLEFYEKNKNILTLPQKLTVVMNIVNNAFVLNDPEACKTAVSLFGQLPENEGKQTIRKENARCQIVGGHLGAYSGKNAFVNAEKFYEAEKAFMDPEQKIGLYSGMISQNLRFFGDEQKIDYYLAEMTAVKGSKEIEERLARKKSDTLVNIIQTVAEFDQALGEKYLNRYSKQFSEQQNGRVLCAFAKNAAKTKNRDLYDRIVLQARQLNDVNFRYRCLLDIANSAAGSTPSEKILNELLAEPLAPQLRIDVLNAVCPRLGHFNYGLNEPGSYQKFKQIRLEIMQLTEQNHLSGNSVYASTADMAFFYGDYDFANQMLKKQIAVSSEEAHWQMLSTELVRTGKTAEASALLGKVLNSSKVNKNDKETAAYIKYFLDGGAFDGFDAAFADKSLSAEKKMKAVRSVSRFFFNAKQFEKARSLSNEVIEKMFRPLESGRHYSVTYDENVPKTAEAWSRMEDYHAWDKMDTRFYEYAGYDIGDSDDVKHLKDTPEKVFDPAHRAGMRVIAGKQGVHIFLRIDDPNVEEVNQGKRGGPGLEWVFHPGAEHAYHSFHFGSLPNTDDRHYVNWAAPTKHYRLTYDTVFKDAVTTPQGYAAHAFIPWIAVHDKMPSKNNVWGIGVQIWDGANTKTNSGTVHELSRLISLDFDFTPAQRIAIERETALQAFNSYNHIRQDAGGVIQNWNDAVLGDPDFYAAELADFIAELDEAGKRLNAPAPDSEIHAIYEKYVPVWQEIKYILDEKRGEYLRKKLIQ